jgi:hypothetical protein
MIVQDFLALHPSFSPPRLCVKLSLRCYATSKILSPSAILNRDQKSTPENPEPVKPEDDGSL